MKSLILSILISILIPSVSYPADIEQAKEVAKYMGVVYVGMPKVDLYEVYTEAQLKGYHKEGNEEWLTFSDWMTEKPGDLITFYLVDGKVKGWKEE